MRFNSVSSDWSAFRHSIGELQHLQCPLAAC